MLFRKTLHLKFAPGAQGRFRGIAAGFSATPDRHGDVIVPGAFNATLEAWRARGARIPVLWQHDQSEPIGAIHEAAETSEGLEVEGQLAAGVGNAERAMKLLETGAMSMSIGFEIPPDSARLRGDGVRELRAISLVEISLVSVPADPFAVVRQVKSDIRSFEAAARDVLGLSSREAKRLAAGGYAALVRDESPEPHNDALAINAALLRIANLKV